MHINWTMMGISMEITSIWDESVEKEMKRDKTKIHTKEITTSQKLFKQWNIQKWYLFGKQANTNIKNIITFHLTVICSAFTSSTSFLNFTCVCVYFSFILSSWNLLWQSEFVSCCHLLRIYCTWIFFVKVSHRISFSVLYPETLRFCLRTKRK